MNIPGFGLRLVLLQRTKMLPGKQLHRPQRMDRERRDAKPLFPGKIGDPHHGPRAWLSKRNEVDGAFGAPELSRVASAAPFDTPLASCPTPLHRLYGYSSHRRQEAGEAH
jgi:hypothetical protein